MRCWPTRLPPSLSPARLGRWLLSELLPGACQRCAEPDPQGDGLCAACKWTLPWQPPACPRCALPCTDGSEGPCAACKQSLPALEGCWASLSYRGAAAQLLRQYKFHQDLAAGRLLARLMLQSPPPWPLPLAVAVPLHDRRLRQRGYDQAEQLLRQLQLPRWHGLYRTRATPPQSERNAAARRHNLQGAFALRAMPPPSLLLVDDVMTTGSTLHEAANVLRQGGCRHVYAWVCARVP